MTDAPDRRERLYCDRCNWRAEPGIAMKNECPNCGSRLRVEFADGTSYKGVEIWWDGELKHD